MQPFHNLGKVGARHEVKLRTHITLTRIPTRTKKERERNRGRKAERERKQREFTDPLNKKSRGSSVSGVV